ncbi:MAG: metallophosphoesterase [Bacillota bacterium]|nr:metallophosphoesterase [Bacillota bacterium]
MCILLAVFLLTNVVIIYGSNHWIRVTQTVVDIGAGEAFDGYRIVHITDLHAKEFGEGQKELLSKVKDLEPDCIAVTGDMLDRSGDNIEDSMQFMNDLTGIAPVYFVEGNHEVWHPQFEDFIKGLREQSVCILNNQSVLLEKNGEILRMAGVQDPFTDRDDLPLALRDCDSNKTTILLAHAPEIFGEAEECGVDLMLAGHYHGGQIRFPFVGAVYAPGGHLFPEYDSGLYQKGNTYMYLSRGLGYTGICQFRYLNRPELALIILQ